MNPNAGLPFFYYPLLLWSIFFSGIALWRAAKLNQRNWFIFFLIVRTGGILELVYLFYFAKKRLTVSEVKTWFRNLFFIKSK